MGLGFFGDYQVIASKRAEFLVVALERLQCYAISKSFLFKTVFRKFPGLHSEMQAEAFVKYQRTIRKPCILKKEATCQRLDSKKQFSSIHLEDEMKIPQATKMKALYEKTLKKIEERKQVRSIAHTEKDEIVEQFQTLEDYKMRLERVNSKAERMFNSMTEIKASSLANMTKVDKAVLEGEKNFVHHIDQLIKLTKSREEV